tara:strand:+ start:1335 stop:5630 length:4296 start_codon:yes stop_codon:yes gene_type:complete
MVDLSGIPQYDSGVLDVPVDRMDAKTKETYKTGNAKIDRYLNSKFNKSVNNITNKLGNFIFNPKKKINLVIKGADLLTGGGVSKNVELGVSQLRAIGEDASKQVLSQMGKLRNLLKKNFGITHTRGMDKSKLTPAQLKLVNEIDDLADFEIGLRSTYKADTTVLANAIKKDKTPMVKKLSKEIDQAENWKTTFSNVFPGIKTSRQTSKKVSQLPGIAASTPSGSAKVYQFTYKGLAAKHGGNKKLDEIIRNKKHPKHQEVMDTFNDSIKKYSKQMDELFQYRDDMLESYADDLIEVYTKYGDDAGQGVIDFAHKFPVSQTGRMNQASELLDKAGNPEYLYLSPSFVNRKVQVFFDDLAENVMTGKPLSYVNRPLATQGYKTATRRVDPFDNMTMNMAEGVYTSPKQFDEFIEIGNKSKSADSIKSILNKIDSGLKNVKAQSSYSIYNPRAKALAGTNKDTFNLTLGKNLETKADMKELLNYLLDPSVTKDTLISPFKDGGYKEGAQPTNSVESFQTFFEEGVGDKEYDLRTLGTLWNGKLLTAPSSGFGGEYAAENLPILKDMDPLSRGIWNTVAPYGEKAFDILDTLFRLPGAFAGDTAEGLGVSEDEANKLQAELNTMLFMPVAGGPVSNAGRIKNAQNAVNNVKKVKKEIIDSSKTIEKQGPMPLGEKTGPFQLTKPKNVGLGFTSRINPNTKKLQLSYEGEVIGEFNSLADAQATIKKINAGKWEGKTNYKSEKKTSTKPWIIEFPGQTNTMEFKTRKDAQLYIDKNYAGTDPINLPTIKKMPPKAGEKTGDFSRYSVMFDDIAESYSPTETKTASQWIGELKNRGHTQELDKTGFGYSLWELKDQKISAADLFTLRKNKGTQIKTEPIRMNKKEQLDLRGEFDTLTNEYNDFLNVSGNFRGSLPTNVQNFIQTKVNNFQKYYQRVLDNTDGRINARQEAVLNDKIDKILAEITIAAEKAQGGNAWTPMLRDTNAANFSLNVYQASSDILTRTQAGSAARRFLNGLKNIRENFGTTASHKEYTLPGKAQNTHKTEVYTYNPIKGQKNTKDIGNTHMGQNNELAHVRKTERTSTDGQNGILLDEMQFDTMRNVAKSEKPVFKPEIHANQAEALTNQLNQLENQKNRIFNSELKKLLIKSDVDDATDYNLPQNQRALMERVKEIPDNDPNLAKVKEKILADFGSADEFMAQQNNKAYSKVDDEIKRINTEFKDTPTQANSMPDIPFRQQTEMIKEILKREIELAIKGNKDFIAIPSPEVVMGYEQGAGSNLAVAFNNIYRKRSLEAIRSIQDEYIKKLEKLGIDSKPFSIRAGDDVEMFIAWDKKAPTNDTFMAKMKSIYNNFNLNDPAILEMIEAGTYKEPFRPINYGSVPGGKNAVQPGIVIDLRNIKGFDRKLLAKIGFQEYKEGGKTEINKYSALAGIDILGVAV